MQTIVNNGYAVNIHPTDIEENPRSLKITGINGNMGAHPEKKLHVITIILIHKLENFMKSIMIFHRHQRCQKTDGCLVAI